MRTLQIIAVALTLLSAVSAAQAKPQEVSFRNIKDDSLKLYCTKNTGRLQTTIRCDGKLFRPDADWEEITAEKICFQNNDNGNIRACHEVGKLDGTKKGYVCFDLKKKPFSFLPGKEWQRVAESDKVCGELIHSAVIRYTDMPPLDIEW